jgi:hypothetical protein
VLKPLIACAVLAISSTAGAEVGVGVDAERSNTVTLNAVPFMFEWLDIQYERAVDERTSLFVGPLIGFQPLIGGPRFAFLGLSLGARRYLTGSALDGLYVSAESVWASHVSRQSPEDTNVEYTFGGSVGYSGKILDRLVLALGFGAQYTGVLSTTGTAYASKRVGFLPLIRLAGGVTF